MIIISGTLASGLSHDYRYANYDSASIRSTRVLAVPVLAFHGFTFNRRYISLLPTRIFWDTGGKGLGFWSLGCWVFCASNLKSRSFPVKCHSVVGSLSSLGFGSGEWGSNQGRVQIITIKCFLCGINCFLLLYVALVYFEYLTSYIIFDFLPHINQHFHIVFFFFFLRISTEQTQVKEL